MLCSGCGARIAGDVEIKDIAMIAGKIHPVRGRGRLFNDKLDASRMIFSIAQRNNCLPESVQLSIISDFKIPGEALLVTGYGVESCGVVCPVCSEIVSVN